MQIRFDELLKKRKLRQKKDGIECVSRKTLKFTFMSLGFGRGFAYISVSASCFYPTKLQKKNEIEGVSLNTNTEIGHHGWSPRTSTAITL